MKTENIVENQEQEAYRLNKLNKSSEFSIVYKIVVRYSDAGWRGQMAERTLYVDNEKCASENVSCDCQNSLLGSIVDSMDKAAGAEYSNDCARCRYKVGNYTGDPTYMLYLIFKTRIGWKFAKFKWSLRNMLRIKKTGK